MSGEELIQLKESTKGFPNLTRCLQLYRVSKGLTLRGMGEVMGLDSSTYHRLEVVGNPSAETLRRVVFWLLEEGEGENGKE